MTRDLRELPGTPAPAVVRSAGILRYIADSPDGPVRITDLARALDMPMSSTSNILAALVDTGLVRRRRNLYSLGPTVVELAADFLRQEDVVVRFRDFVEALPTVSEETVQLGMLSESEVVYLARHAGNQPIALTSSIGKRLPASATALGKAMLSALDDDAVAALLAEPLPQLSVHSHRTLESLRVDLAETRARRYAIDDEEASPNVVCLAVRVPGEPGDGAHAVSTTLFKSRLNPELERALVKDLTSLAGYLAAG